MFDVGYSCRCDRIMLRGYDGIFFCCVLYFFEFMMVFNCIVSGLGRRKVFLSMELVGDDGRGIFFLDL